MKTIDLKTATLEDLILEKHALLQTEAWHDGSNVAASYHDELCEEIYIRLKQEEVITLPYVELL